MAGKGTLSLLALVANLYLLLPYGLCWNQHERVLLRDIQALTLYADRYTNARRSAPIPQMKCIGGSAGCSAVVPQVVQCYNRGWDGIDVQWECKLDMENSYRFGKVEVSCEGFDYPEDPYILRGSCGLEYTLELTDQGRKRSQDGNSNTGFGSGFFQSQSKGWNSQSSSDSSGVIVFVVILLLAYGVYKLFLNGPSMGQQPHSDDNGQGFQSPPNAPPPPGFKSDFTGSSAGFGNSGFGSNSGFSGFAGNSAFGGQASQGPGFWTGLGTGGMLGYLFGNRRAQPYQSPFYNTWSSPSYSGAMHGNSQPFSAPTSSGVRTASGFGGTKRR
ncbi:store-operated calcium entry-associated regulatory factor [Bombina bombina]|uniref:store-operated calcium entry-associated regulatory factor n=1 Tax=Bombina bombina TaxID=8345 RepID=UPI00235A7460|nr:store-operated calcium entry-associated regulatory factor [Bombina bombina]